MPARRQRPGLGFAIADDTGDQQFRIVERRAIGMRQSVAELAAFVNGTRRFRRDVARDAAGEGELFEQFLHPRFVLRDVRINLAVGALEISLRHQPRPAVTWAGDVEHAQIAFANEAVEMNIDEVQTGRCAPMAEQSRFDVGRAQSPLE